MTWLERYNADFGMLLRTFPTYFVVAGSRPTIKMCPYNVYAEGPEETQGCGGECINDCLKCWNSEVEVTEE